MPTKHEEVYQEKTRVREEKTIEGREKQGARQHGRSDGREEITKQGGERREEESSGRTGTLKAGRGMEGVAGDVGMG